MRTLRIAAALAAVLTLAGCEDAVGTGVTLVGIFLGNDDGTLESLSNFECLTANAKAWGMFEGNGTASLADYSGRVEWRSSDPATLLVGDGVTRGPDGAILAPGYFVGLKPGLATLEARYLDFTDYLAVEILPIDALRISPTLTHVGAQLSQQFEFEAQLAPGTAWTSLAGFGRWTLSGGNSAVVDTGSGLVSANSARPGEPLELRATLPACNRFATTTFAVDDVQRLALDYEAGEVATLPLGYTEAVAVHGVFAAAGSTRQNLSTQATVADLDDDVLGVAAHEDALLVSTTGSEGRGGFSVRLPGTALAVASKRWDVVSEELAGLALTPASQTITFPATGGISALGTFDDGIRRPVTRDVDWSSSSAAVSVTPGTTASAELTVSNVREVVTLTASETRADGETVRAEARVDVRPYGSAP